MRILIVSATEKEIQPLLDKLSVKQDIGGALRFYTYKKFNVDVLITGVGMVSTAYYCAKTINDSYDFAMNLGIAGSFKKEIRIGEVVNVTKDIFSELGAEDGEKFLSLKDLDLRGEDKVKNDSKVENSVLNALLEVSGITVNTVHGNRQSIEKIIQRFNPDIETMEGAAFLFACKNEGIPCAQVRAVSNHVEPRNKNKWNIPLAIKKLNEKAVQILDVL